MYLAMHENRMKSVLTREFVPLQRLFWKLNIGTKTIFKLVNYDDKK